MAWVYLTIAGLL